MRVLRTPAAAWRLAGIAALAAFALARLPGTLVEARGRMFHAAREWGGPEEAALARFRGAAYVEAIRKIRAAIPEDGEYAIFASHGEEMLIRFDLAPRRAIFGGELRDLARDLTPAAAAALPRWTVLPGTPPRLVETRALAESGPLP